MEELHHFLLKLCFFKETFLNLQLSEIEQNWRKNSLQQKLFWYTCIFQLGKTFLILASHFPLFFHQQPKFAYK
jgi:hypothetical protein